MQRILAGGFVEKDFKTVLLLDIYSGLLTDKQLRLCDMYYNQDYSLSEIAEIEKTTRQAARDGLEKARRKLLFFEANLGICDKRARTLEIVEKANSRKSEGCMDGVLKKIAEIWGITDGV